MLVNNVVWWSPVSSCVSFWSFLLVFTFGIHYPAEAVVKCKSYVTSTLLQWERLVVIKSISGDIFRVVSKTAILEYRKENRL